MSKILIAYYSRRGQNYLDGAIVDLKRGNTEIVAEKIAHILGGDLFRIDTVEPYPKAYEDTTRQAQKELSTNARPKLVANVPDLGQYDTVCLGYPNWWGTMPMANFTFLESGDFSGKTILPFCTHEGSGMGHSESDISSLCPKAKLIAGIAVAGNRAATCDAALLAHFKKLVLIKEEQ